LNASFSDWVSLLSRYCDTCGTKLPKGHGFVTKGNGLSCGRVSVRRTTVGKDGMRSLVSVKVPCAKAAGL